MHIVPFSSKWLETAHRKRTTFSTEKVNFEIPIVAGVDSMGGVFTQVRNKELDHENI